VSRVRWVVLVEQPGGEGLPFVFGAYFERERADDLASRLNARLEDAEEAARDGEDARREDAYGGFEPPSDLTYGRAYTRLLRPWSAGQAFGLATGDETA
jgi:hypothetical protein